MIGFNKSDFDPKVLSYCPFGKTNTKYNGGVLVV